MKIECMSLAPVEPVQAQTRVVETGNVELASGRVMREQVVDNVLHHELAS